MASLNSVLCSYRMTSVARRRDSSLVVTGFSHSMGNLSRQGSYPDAVPLTSFCKNRVLTVGALGVLGVFGPFWAFLAGLGGGDHQNRIQHEK